MIWMVKIRVDEEGKAGMVVDEMEGGGLVFFKLSCTYCHFAWVVVVACVSTLSLSHTIRSLSS